MTSIEWVKNNDGSDGKTWNPIRAVRMVDDGKGGKMALRGWHCEPVHGGCRDCYAEDQNEAGFRGGTKLPYKPGHRKDVDIFLDEKVLLAPLHWRKPTKVFPCSMTDLFGDWVTDEMLDKVHAIMALQSQHTWIVLTKRPRRRCDYLNDPQTPARIEAQMNALAPDHWCSRELDDHGGWPLKNVWQIVSCSEQKDVDDFIPLLLNTPAIIRGVSLEPLLGPVDITDYLVMTARTNREAYLDWAIAGGESGSSGRFMHPEWESSVRDQCALGGAAYFLKQWGAWAWAPEELNYEQALAWGREKFGQRVSYKHHSSGHTAFRVGKRKSGALRDGVAHMAWPEVRA